VISNDVLIIGDSFCVRRENEKEWPFRLNNLLTGESIVPRGRGLPGCSWWAGRKVLLESLKNKPKLIIFCHTEKSRIPHTKNLSLNLSTVMAHLVRDIDNPNDSSGIVAVTEAAKKYYEQLYDPRYANWSVKRWFDELDDILTKENIEKVIHLYSIPVEGGPGSEYDYDSVYKFKRGVTVLKPLVDYTEDLTDTTLKNHLTEEDNIKLADSLYEIINNYPGDGVSINKIM
jgi:hypothetical protein